MRRRIISGAVVSVIFIGVVFFSIFLLDWYSDVDVRKYTDIGWYDDTIENPVQVGKDLVKGAGEKVKGANDKLMDDSNKIDKKLGISKDDSGLWGSSSEEDTGDVVELDKKLEEDSKEVERNPEEYKLGGFYTYRELQQGIKYITSDEEDKELLLALSPHHSTTVEGNTIWAKNNKEGVEIKYKDR